MRRAPRLVAGGAEASPEPAPESLVGDSRPPATVHSVSNPLPELELVPQSDVQRKAVATASNGKVTPRVNIPVTRVDSAVLQQGEFGSNLAPTGTAVGSSAEVIRDPSSTSPNELGPRTPPPSDVSGSLEPDVGPSCSRSEHHWSGTRILGWRGQASLKPSRGKPNQASAWGSSCR